jgi:glycosyltransferase involved in cell wall biosynthesis
MTLNDNGAARPCDTVVLTPVYNDWASLRLLLPKLDAACAARGLRVEVLAVDDASTLPAAELDLKGARFGAVGRVSVLELRRNSGHQRAISLGLAYVEEETDFGTVVVMDADGEDDPDDVPRLLDALAEAGRDRMVFAHRERRSEGLVFRLFYLLYRKLFALLIGRNVQFGNFSAVPRPVLRRLVSTSEIWNHYAIGVLKARIPYVEVRTRRARRLTGRTHMNFVSLVIHGLSAISIYGDVLGVRALILTVGMMIPVALAACAAVVIRLTTDLAIPGWATYVVALALMLISQFVILSLFFVFIVLSSRNNSNFLPARDYRYFIDGARVVYEQHD